MLESMLKICIYTGINADVTLEDNGRTTECEDRARILEIEFVKMSIHKARSTETVYQSIPCHACQAHHRPCQPPVS